jgi:hypothetical protein
LVGKTEWTLVRNLLFLALPFLSVMTFRPSLRTAIIGLIVTIGRRPGPGDMA